MVPLFEEQGINHFAVFDYEEALRVQNSMAHESDIMIMGWIGDNNLENTIQKGF